MILCFLSFSHLLKLRKRKIILLLVLFLVILTCNIEILLHLFTRISTYKNDLKIKRIDTVLGTIQICLQVELLSN